MKPRDLTVARNELAGFERTLTRLTRRVARLRVLLKPDDARELRPKPSVRKGKRSIARSRPNR